MLTIAPMRQSSILEAFSLLYSIAFTCKIGVCLCLSTGFFYNNIENIKNLIDYNDDK